MKRFVAVIVVGILMLMVTACSVSTANITKAEMAKGYSNGEATDVTTTFSPTDTPIHLVVNVANAPDDTRVKVVWTAVDANGGQITNQKLDETEVKTNGVADFTLSNSQQWPTGKYKVDIYLNDKLDRTIEFTVA